MLAIAAAYSDYSEFDPYLFNTHGGYTHNKEKLFAQWGYTVADARWLQIEMGRQAFEKYLSGDYILGKLDETGQRISIRIEIPRKDGSGTVSFISGWMLEPGGKLRLTTPMEVNKMKMMDCVEVIVEKEKYTREGVHKGMHGWICFDDGSNQSWLVNFPQCGEKEDIAEIVIREEDMKVIPQMDARINERIKAQFDALDQKSASTAIGDISSYLV